MIIGYQGIKGAFSYITCKALYPNEKIVNFTSFTEVFEALENSKINIGVIPIKNSYAGNVDETNKLMQKYNYKIIKKIEIPIKQNLAGIYTTELKEITHIFSHKQALLQCKTKIKTILPNAILIEKGNTAISADFVSKSNNNHYACICSQEAIREYNLITLVKNFQDKEDNTTLFVAISK